MSIRILITISVFLMSQFALAEPAPEQKGPDLGPVIQKLDKVNYLPNLLPMIIDNQEYIGLTQEQVDSLDEWQKTYTAPMVGVMQKIVSKRIEIKQAAFSPTVSSSRLIQMQNEIFRLQREVIEYKLSCREQIIRTFNDENWINFFIVLAEEGMAITVPLNYADATRLQYARKF
jgi:hypothetical protein